MNGVNKQQMEFFSDYDSSRLIKGSCSFSATWCGKIVAETRWINTIKIEISSLCRPFWYIADGLSVTRANPFNQILKSDFICCFMFAHMFSHVVRFRSFFHRLFFFSCHHRLGVCRFFVSKNWYFAYKSTPAQFLSIAFQWFSLDGFFFLFISSTNFHGNEANSVECSHANIYRSLWT